MIRLPFRHRLRGASTRLKRLARSSTLHANASGRSRPSALRQLRSPERARHLPEAPTSCTLSGLFPRRNLIREGELNRVVADVLRPSRNQVRKAAAIVRKQCAESFLESRQIASDSGEEVVSRLLRGANTVVIAPSSASLLHQGFP